MSLLFTCPHCRQSSRLKDEFAGKRVKCRCGKSVDVNKHSRPIQARPTEGGSTVPQLFPSRESAATRSPSAKSKLSREDEVLNKALGGDWRQAQNSSEALISEHEDIDLTHGGWVIVILDSGPVLAFIPFMIGFLLMAMGSVVILMSDWETKPGTTILAIWLSRIGAGVTIAGLLGVTGGLCNKKARAKYSSKALWGVGVSTAVLSVVGFSMLLSSAYMKKEQRNRNLAGDNQLVAKEKDNEGQGKSNSKERANNPSSNSSANRNSDGTKTEPVRKVPKRSNGRKIIVTPKPEKKTNLVGVKLDKPPKFNAFSGGAECPILLADEKIWDVASFNPIAELPWWWLVTRQPGVSVSPDSAMIASFDDVTETIRIYDAGQKKDLPSVQYSQLGLTKRIDTGGQFPHFLRSNVIAHSRNGIDPEDNKRKLFVVRYDIDEGKPLPEIAFECEVANPSTMTFSYDDKMAVLIDNQLKVLDLKEQAIISTLSPPQAIAEHFEGKFFDDNLIFMPIAPRFSLDGSMVACIVPKLVDGVQSQRAEKFLMVWDASTGEVLYEDVLKTYQGKFIEWSPDQKYFIVDNSRLLHRETGYVIAVSKYFLKFLPDGSLLGAFDDFGYVKADIPWEKVERSLQLITDNEPALIRPGGTANLVTTGIGRTFTDIENRLLFNHLNLHEIEKDSESDAEFSFVAGANGHLTVKRTKYEMILKSKSTGDIKWKERYPYSLPPYFVPSTDDAVILPLDTEKFLVRKVQ